MGLPIGRSIIEAHGGRLWATSNESQGAIFQFISPAGSRRMEFLANHSLQGLAENQ